VITWRRDPGGSINQTLNNSACNGGNTQVFPSVNVTDDKTPSQLVKVVVRWSGFASGEDTMAADGAFFGVVGPIPFPGNNNGGTLNIVVVARDADGAESKLAGTPVTVLPCIQIS